MLPRRFFAITNRILSNAYLISFEGRSSSRLVSTSRSRCEPLIAKGLEIPFSESKGAGKLPDSHFPSFFAFSS